ncbi:O-antigen ligase family protein [Gordonia hankookensis]|uniref:O-antigen ligase family protein n=1 Tax=Gordonia hankookensis TaxID=589403 RepID=A0ABR7W878_9ACTN|nr:O-antigen ligase family protein [Gordonia hankookensis]MBD1319026.1 O-antigen ligase family protein [Gordonia hankookensis]
MALTFAVAAVVIVLIAVVPFPRPADFDGEELRVIVFVVAITAWPMAWTFLFGPMFLGGPGSHFFPFIWFAPAMCVAVVILAANVNAPACRVRIPVVLLMTLLPMSLLPLVNDGRGGEVLRWGVWVVLMLAVLTTGRGVRLSAVAVGCRIGVLLTAPSIAVAVVCEPDVVVANCRVDKCGLAGHAITSPFSGNGNVLGLTLALMLPFALAGTRVGRAAMLVLASALLADLAGSRTALLGIAVVTVLHFALRVAYGRMRDVILALGLFSTLTISLMPAVLVYGDEAFALRGVLWNRAKAMIVDFPLFGQGPTAWEHFGFSSIIKANYSPHNAWLDMGVSVGLWGILVVVGSAVLLVCLASRRERETLIVYFCVLLAISTLESVFVPYFLGIVAPFAALLPFFVGRGDSAFGAEPKRDIWLGIKALGRNQDSISAVVQADRIRQPGRNLQRRPAAVDQEEML